MDKAIMILALACLLGACSTTKPVGSLCPLGPFVLDKGASERLTRAEKEYVVTLNNSGEQICGWAP